MYLPKERIQSANSTLPNSSKTAGTTVEDQDDVDGDDDDGSFREVYQQNKLRRQSEWERSLNRSSTSGQDGKNGIEESGSQRFRRIFCQCLERDRWCFCFHITFECTKFALQQRSTIFVLLLFIDFIFNTFMFYYEYVYIMVDVDVRTIQGIGQGSSMSGSPLGNNDDENGGGGSGSSSGLTNGNTGDNFNDQDQTGGGGGGGGGSRTNGGSKADSDSKNSISFDQSGQQKVDRSYQYEINLIVYILIYLSEINGFYAYLWSKNQWLIVHLIVVCVELIFLLFLLFINIHLIIVYLIRLALFFMSLHKSLTISDYEMIVEQSKSNQHGLNCLPVIRVITPSSTGSGGGGGKPGNLNGQMVTSRKQIMSTLHETSSTSASSAPWSNKSSRLTVSNQNGIAVGFITVSSELEKRDCFSTDSIGGAIHSQTNKGGPSSVQIVGSFGQTPSWMCRVKPILSKLDNCDEQHQQQQQQTPPTNITKVLPIKRSEPKK